MLYKLLLLEQPFTFLGAPKYHVGRDSMAWNRLRFLEVMGFHLQPENPNVPVWSKISPTLAVFSFDTKLPGLIASQRSQNQPFTLSCPVKVNMISERLPAQGYFRASLCPVSQLRTKRPAGTRPSLCPVRVGPVGLETRRKKTGNCEQQKDAAGPSNQRAELLFKGSRGAL